MTKHQKILFATSLFTIYYLLFTIPSRAEAQTFSLGIYPPLLEAMVMPGKSMTQVFKIENSGDEMMLNTQILPFEPKDEFGNISIRGATSLEVAPPQDWFNFENADISLGRPFILKSGESRQIILRIKIPENAREDDYYFTFLIRGEPKRKISGPTTLETGVIGTNILLTVSRTDKPAKKGEIVEFKLLNCYMAKLLPFCLAESSQKPDFLLRVKNTSRTFWKPFGKIKIEGPLGQKWEKELLPENVLADSVRQIQMTTASASPTSRFALPASLFLIGPYRAKVEFNTEEDGSGEILSSSLSFIALPVKLFLGILIGILIFLTILKAQKLASQGLPLRTDT